MSNFPPLPEETAVDDHSNWDPTPRNRYLKALLPKLKRYELTVRELHGKKHNKAAQKVESQAQRTFNKACGSCIMDRVCPLAYDFQAWADKHPMIADDKMPIVSAPKLVAILQQRSGARC